jgi:hypothetical protein
MFEVVAVQQVPAGVVGEPHGHLDGFAWRDIDGVLPPAVVWAWAPPRRDTPPPKQGEAVVPWD